MDLKQLTETYDIPTPRYNCYPATPYWKASANSGKWLQAVRKAYKSLDRDSGMILYLHMPFCESLCRFCGFDKRITRNHFMEEIYIEALSKEWSLYRKQLADKPRIRQIYMGGGTPTFFSPRNLETLYRDIIPGIEFTATKDLTFESHPHTTSEDHLSTLYDFGFRSVSFGIQDFNEKTLKLINREQPYEKVKFIVNRARQIGYSSVKFDLIYGLPTQTTATIKSTIEKVGQFMPNVVAFYSYMHLPWEQPGQLAIKESTIPGSLKKRKLMETGREELEKLGYKKAGLDHYVLKGEPLYHAMKTGKLKRNFIGYSHIDSPLLLGLGAIAVSETEQAYAQNIVNVENYHDRVFSNQIPAQKMHFLSKEDQLIKGFIHDLMCRLKANWSQELFDTLSPETKYEIIRIQKAGLIDMNPRGLEVTKRGAPFLRYICMVFDAAHQRYIKKKLGAARPGGF